MATVDDRGIYSCLSAEWGTWGIRRYSLVNVIGELTDKRLLGKTKKNCVNIKGEGRGGKGVGLILRREGAPVMVQTIQQHFAFPGSFQACAYLVTPFFLVTHFS